MPNKTDELRQLYWQQSQYNTNQTEKKYEHRPLLQWPANGYFDRLKPDADLLEQAIAPNNPYDTVTLAQQVFGQDLKQQQIHLQHTAHLFYERCQLHQQHLYDIDDSHIKVQERLFGVEINHFSDRSKQLRTLEGQLMQLEQQRRDEELAFWKDTVDLRSQLLENGANYRDTRQRLDVFAGVEESYARK